MGRKVKDVRIDVEALAACEELAAKESVETRRNFAYIFRSALYAWLRARGYKIAKGLEV
jgi:hypothetical protein